MKLLLLALILCLVFQAGTSLGDGPITITRLTDLQPSFDLPGLLPGSCIVGNFNSTNLQLVEHSFLGYYFFNFYPHEVCDCFGFRVTSVHMLIGIQEATYIDISVGWSCIYFTHIGDDPIWMLPIQDSEVLTASFSSPGIYEISFPFSGDECAFIEYGYGILVRFPQQTDLAFGVASTNLTYGRSINHGGVQECPPMIRFCGLVGDYGWPGEIAMWADAECCEPPVKDEHLTWGGVKSLYR